MAAGLSTGTAEDILEALLEGVPFSVPQRWVKLHVGDPGASGEGNPATETTRHQASFSVTGNAALNTSPLVWEGVAGSEEYSHFSVWTASTGGSFLFSGAVTADAVTANQVFIIPTGALSVQLPVAS